MRPHGTRELLAYLRRLAVERSLEGCSIEDIAGILSVAPRSVRRWIDTFNREGWAGLEPRGHPGRRPRLTASQQRQVLDWIDRSPQELGFTGSRWTARRLACVIQQRLGIQFHSRYLNRWLKRRAITPQKPRPAAREKDPQTIARWLATDWPAVKKTPWSSGPPWDSLMNRAF